MVARLVYLAAAQARDMVGEELQRNGGDDRRELGARLGNEHRVCRGRGGGIVAFRRDGDHRRVPRSALLHVAERLLLAGNVGEKRDDRCLLRKEREASVVG